MVDRSAVHSPHRRLAVSIIIEVHAVQRVDVVPRLLRVAQMNHIAQGVRAKGGVLDFIHEDLHVFRLKVRYGLESAPCKICRIQLLIHRAGLFRASIFAAAETEFRVSVVNYRNRGTVLRTLDDLWSNGLFFDRL